MQKKAIESLMWITILNTFIPLIILLLEVLEFLSTKNALVIVVVTLSTCNMFIVGKYAKYLEKGKSKTKKQRNGV